MKIALVLFNLAVEAGAPRFLLSFAQALKRQGHDVVIFTAEYSPNCFPPLTKGLDIREIKGSKSLSSVVGAKDIFGKILNRVRWYGLVDEISRDIVKAMDKDFDIVNCHTDFSYRVGSLYKKINPKAKFIWTMHDSPFDFNPKSNVLLNLLSRVSYFIEEIIERGSFKGADLVAVLDERNAKISRGFGLKTEIIRGGVDFEAFYGPTHNMPAGSKKIRLVSVGSLGPYRGFEDTISATAALRKRGYDASALIVCEDFWSNGPYRKNFESFIENSGAKEYIDARFKGVPENQFKAVYRDSDVYVYATNIKIWGMAPFEAMTAGLPAIICDASSDIEVLINRENALFVPPHRPDKIADCVEDLISSPDLYAKVASGGQKFVRDNLTWEKYAANFLKSVSNI
ncbi:MAG: glycosyltransferase family 4 protein [Patescibacteria group bacterium]|nr:glycosyltransferase family 4 protein [Patescibacteria group bacterium]MDE2015245.1 glycosyltransferase family 4 protein [Patescibacteria group bacterium]MDE2227051.1 glycosyltransferase family 4 protein [Patescibacteria group bacterium]